MALMDLNRSNDTPIATLKLSTIVPVNWHRFPPRTASMVKPHVPVITYTGGDIGDDVDEASANATTDYQPRNQDGKAALMVPPGSLAVDISRARGTIEPKQPYPVAGYTPPAAPVITTITPNTAVSNTGKLIALLVGTGFTPWSVVRTGAGRQILRSEYISATLMQLLVDPTGVPPGTYQCQVVDHDVESAPVPFTIT